MPRKRCRVAETRLKPHLDDPQARDREDPLPNTWGHNRSPLRFYSGVRSHLEGTRLGHAARAMQRWERGGGDASDPKGWQAVPDPILPYTECLNFGKRTVKEVL